MGQRESSTAPPLDEGQHTVEGRAQHKAELNSLLDDQQQEDNTQRGIEGAGDVQGV